jgi:membrane protease subunit HflK
MSLNDPNWGRGSRGPGGNQGPPDLDELWRNFNRKLNDLFGGRRGGGDRPPSPPSGRALGGGAGVLVALVLAIWLASGFYVVDAASRGVVLTFGKFSEITDPGLRWRMPFPVQSHEIVNLSQVRTLEVGYRNQVKTKVLKESLMLTDDENIVDLQFAVQYVVTDAQAWLFNNRRPEEVAMLTAEAAMREIIGKSKMDAILYGGQDNIANQAQVLMQQILDNYKTGISLSRVTPPQIANCLVSSVTESPVRPWCRRVTRVPS